MLQPKRTKFRKAFKGRIHGNAKGGPPRSFRSRPKSSPAWARRWSKRKSKMAAIDDLKQKSDDQLEQQLGELKREQFNLRFQSATNQLEKPSRVRVVRRTIARIIT